MRILLFKGRGIISALIRWQTRSRKYSHVAVLFDDGALFEAWQGAGIRQTTLKPGGGVDFYSIDDVTPTQIAMARAYCESQVGKGYDYAGVLRFVTRRIKDTTKRMFCSEYVMRIALAMNVELLRRVLPEQISPEQVSYSPRLTLEKQT